MMKFILTAKEEQILKTIAENECCDPLNLDCDVCPFGYSERLMIVVEPCDNAEAARYILNNVYGFN
jgi:hypothetical protein